MLAALEAGAHVGNHCRGVAARFPVIHFSPIDFWSADKGEQRFHFRDSVFCASIGVEYRESLKKVLRSRHSAKLNLENVVVPEFVLFTIVRRKVRAITIMAHDTSLILAQAI